MSDKYQVVCFSGRSNERMESEWRSYDDAVTAMYEQFPDDTEREELGVDILKNWSTEY